MTENISESRPLDRIDRALLSALQAEGRLRLYRLDPAPLAPMHEWLGRYERIVNDRLDRMDDYLQELQRRERER